MNKKDLIEKIASENGNSYAEEERLLNLLLDVLEEALLNNQKIALRGFGTLKVKVRKERGGGINPSTKEKIVLPEMKTVTFKIAKQLKEKLNK